MTTKIIIALIMKCSVVLNVSTETCMDAYHNCVDGMEDGFDHEESSRSCYEFMAEKLLEMETYERE